MTEPRDGLDLSILAQVTRESDDAAPTLPDGADRVTTGSKQRDRTLPRPDTTGFTPPSAPRTGRPRAPRARSSQDTDTGRTVTRDDAAPPQYRPGVLVKPLEELYTAMGTMLLPFNQPVATAVLQNARPCAESLDNLARTNPAVRRALMSLLQTGAWGQVIAAHMPIMLALAVTLNPKVRQAMEGQPPDASTNETVNPVSNGYGQMRQP